MQEVALQAEKNSSVSVPSYSIEKSEDVLKFDMIYNALLGMTQGQNITNTYNYVYRVEKNSNSKKAYEPEDTTSVIEEPFSYQKVINYKTLQKTADLTDSGQLIISYGDKYVPDKQDVDLGSVEYTDLTQKVEIVLVSGNRKSGVSTFSTAMAVSQVSGGKKVSMLDLSGNKGLEHVLQTGNIPYSKWSLPEILTSESLRQEHGVSLINDFRDEIKVHVLRHVLSNIHRFECQTLYIDVNFEDFDRIVEQLRRYNFKTFLLSCPDIVDIKEINKLFSKVSRADLVLSGHIKYQKQYKALDPSEIKRSIDNLNRLVAPIEFVDFDLDDNWVNVLLEVK
nr:hypothetical protein [uncultured bacterium]